MSIDEIFINQLAQRIASRSSGETWFGFLESTAQRTALGEIFFFVLNASPRREEALKAIDQSGLNPTYTPCVLLTKYDVREALAKIGILPVAELPKAFILAITLLGISDEKRRTQRCSEPCSHWWHRDLRDPTVTDQIGTSFRSEIYPSSACWKHCSFSFATGSFMEVVSKFG